MKKITKIITFYDDGTFSESIPAIDTTALNTTCSKCGLSQREAMGYVCSQPQCPTGRGGPWS